MSRPSLEPIDALIVSAHPEDHARLSRKLCADEALSVSASIIQARDLLEALNEEGALGVGAHVVLLDDDCTDPLARSRLIEALASARPDISIVIFTSRDGHEALLMEAEATGPIAGVLTKDEDPRSLAIALRRVYRGEPVLSSRPMRLLLDVFHATSTAEGPLPRTGCGGEPTSLPPRLRSVYGLLLGGQSNRRIARSLGITENTARVYVSDVLHRLGYSSRAELIAGALS